MGVGISNGKNNDELVDNLVESRYIRTKEVERVFRAVDRADYMLPSHKENAYRDLAWKYGNIHLSAPCVYGKVLEGLRLKPGMSFLHLGSGTGYLSTMAGLILNQHGTNHGIELHQDCLKYSYERLEQFKQKSLALDEFDFCEPLFMQGNCLSVAPGRQYDRVYCGAACPESHEIFIKQFVRIGGILVMTSKDQLLCLRRKDEDTWFQYKLLYVSFATLIIPTPEDDTLFHLPECDPLSLQELCRGKVRHCLRQNVWYEHPEVETRKPIISPKRPKSNLRMSTTLIRPLVFPIYDESNESISDDEEECVVRVKIQKNRFDGRLIWQQLSSSDGSSYESFNEYNIDTIDPDAETAESKNDSSNEESFPIVESISTVDNTYDSMEDEPESQVQKQNDINVSEKSSKKVYFDMSDNDSDVEEEDIMIQRKKVAKREKIDAEDSNISSNTNQSESETVNPDDSIDEMDVDLSDITVRSNYNSHSSSSDNTPAQECIGHYVDSIAFTSYMIEKIHQLPLPFPLKLYINYNREL